MQTNMHDFTRGARVHNPAAAAFRPLSESELRRAVPSAFAEQAASDVSGRYLFIPTFELIRRVSEQTGLVPVRAREQTVREPDHAGFARHEITFRLPDAGRAFVVGDTVAELRLTNSHNRSSAYHIDAGLWRFACSNGLLVSDAMLPGIRVRHTGGDETLRQVIEGTCTVIREVPQLHGKIETLAADTLTDAEQFAFARAATVARWGEAAPVRPAALLEARRPGDVGSDAWRTLNRVQENIMQGGQRGRAATGRRLRTRPVQSITEDQRINRALFVLMDALRSARSAA